MRTSKTVPPLPRYSVGEGGGEGARGVRTHMTAESSSVDLRNRARSLHAHPHPNPLPEGEGTRNGARARMCHRDAPKCTRMCHHAALCDGTKCPRNAPKCTPTYPNAPAHRD